MSQVCFGAISAGIRPPLFPTRGSPGAMGWGPVPVPRTTHVELVYLGKPAVDDLFREVVPLHQEHVDLRGKAKALQLCGTRHPAAAEALGEPRGCFSFKQTVCFSSTTPMRVALPRQRVSWGLGKLSRDRVGNRNMQTGGNQRGKSPFQACEVTNGLQSRCPESCVFRTF